jgi:predicted nucleotidyltransferase
MTEQHSETRERWIVEVLKAAAPEARVILFGSRARGDARLDSDIDLLVIEPEVKAPRAESARLRRELRGLGLALDLIVVSESFVSEWAHFEGTLVHTAMEEGRELVGA